nr:hypothetical protein [Coleofasciculus sp. FACHB-542]
MAVLTGIALRVGIDILDWSFPEAIAPAIPQGFPDHVRGVVLDSVCGSDRGGECGCVYCQYPHHRTVEQFAIQGSQADYRYR